MHLASLLCRTTQLDIFDLNYVYGAERLHGLDAAPKNVLPRGGLVTRFAAFLVRGAESFVNLFRRPKPAAADLRGKQMFFATTKNQVDALAPVMVEMQGAYLAGGDVHGHPQVAASFPFWLAYPISLMFAPFLAARYATASAYQKRTFTFVADQYLLVYGTYLSSHYWLDRLRPGVIIVANDHTAPHRVLTTAAREKGIPVVYMQHASVTDRFPPLSFDYALLDGEDAMHKYDACGTNNTTVFLTGIAKADAYYPHMNTSPTVRVVGICTNGLDPIRAVENLLSELCTRLPHVALVLRPHPRDARVAEWQQIAERLGVRFSDARSELSFAFLCRVDAVIAGNTNLHLEAALMNVAPIYYDFAGSDLDYYGFRQSGLVTSSRSVDQVERLLRQMTERKPEVRARAKLYCATIATPFDGKSSQLAASIIKRVASGESIDLKDWRQVQHTNLRAFEPAQTETSTNA